jgi:hypothetical protein
VQWSVQTYAEFMAALYALMTVEAITLTEANDFQNQMLSVLGHDPVPLNAKVTGLPYVWFGESTAFVESPNPRLTEVTEVNGHEVETPWGGRFRVHRIDHYADRAVVHWNLDRPENWRELPGALDDHSHDSDGLPESAPKLVRVEVQAHADRWLHHFRLVDDVHTKYLPKHQTISDEEGETTYLPGVPSSATRLFIEWYGWSTEIPFRS